MILMIRESARSRCGDSVFIFTGTSPIFLDMYTSKSQLGENILCNNNVLKFLKNNKLYLFVRNARSVYPEYFNYFISM